MPTEQGQSHATQHQLRYVSALDRSNSREPVQETNDQHQTCNTLSKDISFKRQREEEVQFVFCRDNSKKCVHSVRHPPVSEVSCCVSNDGITLCNVKATKHDSNPAVT